MITLSETHVHAHPGDHTYYKKLVGLYTCICVLIHEKLIFGRAHILPGAAVVVYGNVGGSARRLPGFLGSHACSLSTSLPKSQCDSNFKLKSSALNARRDFMHRVMPWYPVYLRSVYQGIEQNLDLAEGWAAGNCAETLPITRYGYHFLSPMSDFILRYDPGVRAKAATYFGESVYTRTNWNSLCKGDLLDQKSACIAI